MAVLVDTSVLVNVERRGEALDRVIGDQERAISAITVSELLHGVHRASPEPVRIRRQAFVEHLLGSLEALPITTAVARSHARIWADLERDGKLIGAHDLWIAATALAQGMRVVTANPAEFERVPGLAVVSV